MKNIHEILSAIGITVPEDQKADFDKELLLNYKTIADYDKQSGKVAALTDQLKTATDGLKAFEGVDVEDLKGQIQNLKNDLVQKDSEYQRKIADIEFDSLMSGEISSAKGRDEKAIRALLDVDALKASKNQKEDIKSALEQLKTEKNYLFETEETPPPFASGTGTRSMGGKYAPEIADFRAAAGLKNE